MPERKTVQKATQDRRAGKSPNTQAGEFVHEEIRKTRRSEHGARSPQQKAARTNIEHSSFRRRSAFVEICFVPNL
ncbi:hypothetical protein AS156_03465 [Bradyrhizobium macuxiense]|uniref:Uncharacterized protein n=1 Tax=Bradyrhizobium macuxiense TaxID=1755647 RepID=A0A120FPJ0_9BRAD|nr:hypothetical protein [Bradyrhizobium macuxiense]KWV57036.1 hypothetical protein AS156_03465 [Bradyrhizobium macuxiense]